MNKLCCEYITCTRGLLHFKVVHLYSNQIWQNGNTGVGLPNTTVYCSAIVLSIVYWRPLAEIRHGNSDTLRPAHQSPLLPGNVGRPISSLGQHKSTLARIASSSLAHLSRRCPTTTNTEYPWDDDEDNADMMIERTTTITQNDATQHQGRTRLINTLTSTQYNSTSSGVSTFQGRHSNALFFMTFE
jgi:hypothetical protein